MFDTDSRCSLPLHTLITDLIDSQGGSSQLIKCLNNLGVCASADTLARFVQHTTSKEQSVQLDTESFFVLSADNIDIEHKHAQVYKGSQNSSWHGTSIQLVQTRPGFSENSDEEDIVSTQSKDSVPNPCRL